MASDPRVLSPGTRVGDYVIEALLGQGGFGITYCARLVEGPDTASRFAVKEFFPRDIAVRDRDGTVIAAGNDEDRATFVWALDRFREEARTLATLSHPHVVSITRYFLARGTAYLMMPYYDGDALDRILRQRGRLGPSEFERIFLSLIDALDYVHGNSVMHRDIKPANIFITRDGSPILLDFGMARYALGEHSRSVTSVITPGYAPFEQYSTLGSQQGPWSDIYGLSATMYHAVSGKRPPEAFERNLSDTLVPLAGMAGPDFARMGHLVAMIDAGLGIRPEQRPRSVALWRGLATPPQRLGATATGANGNAVAWGSAAAIGVALVLGVGALSWRGSAPPAVLHADAGPIVAAPGPAPVPSTEPAIVPTTPPLPVPAAPASVAPDRDRTVLFDRLQAYVATGSSNDLSQVMAQYGPMVQFYGKLTPKAQIWRDKARYIDRWPDRSYAIRPDSFSYACQNDGACMTRAIIEWTARSPGTGRAAAGLAEMEIVFANGVVVLETSRVIARQH